MNVAINMMDDFSIAQRAAEFLLGYDAMFVPPKKLSISTAIAAAPHCVGPGQNRLAGNPRIILWPFGYTPNTQF